MKGEVTAILCARMSSTRLPGKVLSDIGGKTALEHIINRLRRASCVGEVIIATSTHDDDDAIASFATGLNIPCHRGSLDNVSQRMNDAINRFAPGTKYVFRAMSDQPFFSWQALDESASLLKLYGWDFILPLSFDTEPVYGAALSPWSRRAWNWDNSRAKSDELEHPGMCLRRNLDKFDYGLLDLPKWVYRGHRLELDTHEDLQTYRLIYSAWDGEGPPPLRWTIAYLDRNRQVSAINAGVREKTGTFTSYTAEEIEQWKKDYMNRTIVWSDVSFFTAMMQNTNSSFRCESCGGILIADLIRKGNLIMRCGKCKKRRTFYSQK